MICESYCVQMCLSDMALLTNILLQKKMPEAALAHSLVESAQTLATDNVMG